MATYAAWTMSIVKEFSGQVPAVSLWFSDMFYEVYVRPNRSHSLLTATCEQTARQPTYYCLMINWHFCGTIPLMFRARFQMPLLSVQNVKPRLLVIGGQQLGWQHLENEQSSLTEAFSDVT